MELFQIPNGSCNQHRHDEERLESNVPLITMVKISLRATGMCLNKTSLRSKLYRTTISLINETRDDLPNNHYQGLAISFKPSDNGHAFKCLRSYEGIHVFEHDYAIFLVKYLLLSSLTLVIELDERIGSVKSNQITGKILTYYREKLSNPSAWSDHEFILQDGIQGYTIHGALQMMACRETELIEQFPMYPIPESQCFIIDETLAPMPCEWAAEEADIYNLSHVDQCESCCFLWLLYDTNILKQAIELDCDLVLIPARGSFLRDFNSTSELHIGILCGTVIKEFTKKGIRCVPSNKSCWRECLPLNMLDYFCSLAGHGKNITPARESYESELKREWRICFELFGVTFGRAYFDLPDYCTKSRDLDETFSYKRCYPRPFDENIWIDTNYDSDKQNCFDFAIAFINLFISATSKKRPKKVPKIISKDDFCRLFILPQTKKAAHYIEKHRKFWRGARCEWVSTTKNLSIVGKTLQANLVDPRRRYRRWFNVNQKSNLVDPRLRFRRWFDVNQKSNPELKKIDASLSERLADLLADSGGRYEKWLKYSEGHAPRDGNRIGLNIL